MVNVLLRFVENKRDGKPIAFMRKKVCFVLSGSEHSPQAGEFWECFLWADRKSFFLVKPFRRIEPENVRDEQKKVDDFNKELFLIEKYKNADFTKVVFDPQTNKPYLLGVKSIHELKSKYEDYIIKETDVAGKKQVWGRPILSPADRKEWRESR